MENAKKENCSPRRKNAISGRKGIEKTISKQKRMCYNRDTQFLKVCQKNPLKEKLL